MCHFHKQGLILQVPQIVLPHHEGIHKGHAVCRLVHVTLETFRLQGPHPATEGDAAVKQQGLLRES